MQCTCSLCGDAHGFGRTSPRLGQVIDFTRGLLRAMHEGCSSSSCKRYSGATVAPASPIVKNLSFLCRYSVARSAYSPALLPVFLSSASSLPARTCPRQMYGSRFDMLFDVAPHRASRLRGTRIEKTRFAFNRETFGPHGTC